MVILEYIWLDANQYCRSKTRVCAANYDELLLENIPIWNYDGSSTDQATTITVKLFSDRSK